MVVVVVEYMGDAVRPEGHLVVETRSVSPPKEVDFAMPACENLQCVEKFNAYNTSKRVRRVAAAISLVMLAATVTCFVCLAMSLPRIAEDQCAIVDAKRTVVNCTKCVWAEDMEICAEHGKCFLWKSIRVNHRASNEACASEIKDQVLPTQIKLDESSVPCYFQSSTWDGMTLKDGACASTNLAEVQNMNPQWDTYLSLILLAMLLPTGLVFAQGMCVACSHHPSEKFCTCENSSV